jgi:hypothetical protein
MVVSAWHGSLELWIYKNREQNRMELNEIQSLSKCLDIPSLRKNGILVEIGIWDGSIQLCFIPFHQSIKCALPTEVILY